MRCFIALCLPEEARDSLARTAAICREAVSTSFDTLICPRAPPKISWVRPEAYHLTLAFLGEIGGTAFEAASSALDAASGFGTIDCSFAGIGGLPAGRSPRSGASSAPLWRLLYAKIDEGGGCATLCRAVNGALLEGSRRSGFPPLNPEWPKGGRAFLPHITLARAQAGSGIPAQAASGAGTGLAGAWTIGRCALYKSELRSSGSVYTEIRGVDL
jgi:RNA 2',3'-cyclic 3'-phosphodiesterase